MNEQIFKIPRFVRYILILEIDGVDDDFISIEPFDGPAECGCQLYEHEEPVIKNGFLTRKFCTEYNYTEECVKSVYHKALSYYKKSLQGALDYETQLRNKLMSTHYQPVGDILKMFDIGMAQAAKHSREACEALVDYLKNRVQDKELIKNITETFNNGIKH